MENKKIALVTGASRGLGKAISDRLLQEGWFVVGTATTDAGAAKITERFSALKGEGCGMALDVCNASQLDAVLAQIKADHGPILALVNNAGITRDNLILRMTDEQWDAVHETNLKGVFRLTKRVLRTSMIKARAGRIVNITSVVGVTGNPGQSNYAAMKAGVIAFSKSVAHEVASRGITVNCIAPGFIESDMTDELSDDQKASLLTGIPMGRIGKADDVAESVLFLLGPGGVYMTGETLHVNGGMHMS